MEERIPRDVPVRGLGFKDTVLVELHGWMAECDSSGYTTNCDQCISSIQGTLSRVLRMFHLEDTFVWVHLKNFIIFGRFEVLKVAECDSSGY
jgi:hypothetical protein